MICTSTGRLSFEVNPNSSSIPVVAAGFEGVLVLGTGFGSMIVGVLERGGVFGTTGASVASISVEVVGSTTSVSVEGAGATTSAAASSVAAMPEARSSSEEDTVTSQPKPFGITRIMVSLILKKGCKEGPKRHKSKVHHSTSHRGGDFRVLDFELWTRF